MDGRNKWKEGGTEGRKKGRKEQMEVRKKGRMVCRKDGWMEGKKMNGRKNEK